MLPYSPRLRVESEPGGVPFAFDARTIKNGANFTLVTELGNVDLLGHIDGFSSYGDIKSEAASLTLFGRRIDVLSLGGLIRAKRAAGRPKDLLAIPELEVLLSLQEDDKP